ncbi:hypothetical protein LCX93_00845 [Sulfurimonas sp. SWIR-19]|uniref:hypothetical protein n=1 Tax=Sulfurimonas sp. SWIR-19 TaxID=2878390 RepID=UPI001CF306ED|nr:hypothetical protein [Sulfurimonas sp. SWIR-19]UCN00496.1 hypothetical protein LCX93_00845 [Sulfurimonas sp. SWIR-19]
MWHTKLQIAIIEKNAQRIDLLVSQMPKFETVEEMQVAAALIKEALKLLQQLKDETGETLKKLRQHQDFLGATAPMTNNKFDITS